MGKKTILAILALVTILAITGTAVLITRQRQPPPPAPPPRHQTLTCIQAAAKSGMPSERLELIAKAQDKQLSKPERIRLREELRRRDLPQCESLYQYLVDS